MKKLFLLLLVTNIVLLAQTNYELKLFEKIIPAIFKQKLVKVYTDEDAKELLQSSNKFQLVNNCKESSTVVVTYSLNKLDKNCLNNPMFATSYKAFKNNKNSFGALYWRKGRPQIIFRLDALNRYNLELPEKFQKYTQ